MHACMVNVFFFMVIMSISFIIISSSSWTNAATPRHTHARTTHACISASAGAHDGAPAASEVRHSSFPFIETLVDGGHALPRFLLPPPVISHHASCACFHYFVHDSLCMLAARHKGGSGGRREGKGGAAPQVGWLDDSQVNLTAEVNAEHFSFSPLSARFEMKGFLAGDHGDRSWIMRGLTTNGTRGMNKNKWWGYFSWLYDYRECYVIRLLELLFRYPFRDIFSLFCRHFLW